MPSYIEWKNLIFIKIIKVAYAATFLCKTSMSLRDIMIIMGIAIT